MSGLPDIFVAIDEDASALIWMLAQAGLSLEEALVYLRRYGTQAS